MINMRLRMYEWYDKFWFWSRVIAIGISIAIVAIGSLCSFAPALASQPQEEDKTLDEEPISCVLNQPTNQKRLSAMFVYYYLTVCKSSGISKQQVLKYVNEVYEKDGN